MLLATLWAMGLSATVTLFFEDQSEPELADTLTIKYIVQHKELSLKNGIEPAQKKLKLSIDALKAQGVGKDNIFVSNYRLKPVYKALKDRTKFYGFFVTYEVEVSVTDPSKLGAIVDALVAAKVHQILSIEWDEAEVEGQEQAQEGFVADAVAIAKDLCKTFGEDFDHVEGVEPVEEEEEEEEPEEEEEEQEEEEEEQPLQVYKVTIKCSDKKKKK